MSSEEEENGVTTPIQQKVKEVEEKLDGEETEKTTTDQEADTKGEAPLKSDGVIFSKATPAEVCHFTIYFYCYLLFLDIVTLVRLSNSLSLELKTVILIRYI